MDQLYRSRRESRLFVCFFFFKLMFLLKIMLIYDEPPLAGSTQMHWGAWLLNPTEGLAPNFIDIFFLLPCHGTF